MSKSQVRTWFHDSVAPKRRPRGDLYAFAARARQQGRHGLADDLSSIAESLKIIEGRSKMACHVTLDGRGAPAMDAARGGGDGVPAEVRASLSLRDVAQRLREIREDWFD